MLIKKKHASVIIFSSIIITVVFLSTLVGYNLYIQWKKDSFALKYRNSIYKLNAEIFKKDIVISNVNIKIGGSELFAEMPLLEGSLKNNSTKTITSVRIEVSFLKGDGSVIYKDWFHPLGEQQFIHPILFSGIEHTRNVLLPGEGISFRHLLRNCPKEVFSQLSTKANFAKSNSEDEMKLDYSIAGLSVL